jgi:CheY-like chemotaxis protein
MPGMDGYTLIETLRAMRAEDGGQTPAVALTAFARSEDRQRAMMAGFDLHLAKPVEPGELVAVVNRLARRK